MSVLTTEKQYTTKSFDHSRDILYIQSAYSYKISMA